MPYGQPGYGMPPGDFTPPKQSRKKLWWSIGGGVVAILVVLGVIGAVVGDDSNDKSFGSK
jgi:hypothetical protein